MAWLSAHEYSNGSYGEYTEGQAAAAAYALWLNDSGSAYSANSYSYLARQLEDLTNFLWFESDVPGEVLFSLAITQHLSLLHNPSEVSSRLLRLQQPNGGFEGYSGPPNYQTVTSSVDTALALWGLSYAQAIETENRTAAVNYLLTLQNQDGSFNLTPTLAADPLYSLGPDPVSITALVTLVLRDNGFTTNTPSISKSLGFLENALSEGFGGIGHPYDAALSSLVFLQYYHPREAVSALTYLIAQQNSDGGFRDASRFGSGSNVLDTGWASIALQYGIIEGATVTHPVNRPPTAKFSFNPAEPTNGSAVSFDAGSSSDSDGDGLSYAWTFGDGGSAAGATPIHVFARDGTYTVTLTVRDTGTNPDNLSSTMWRTVNVTQSTAPAKTPTLPASGLNIIELVVIVALATLGTGFLLFRIRKRRALRQ